MAGSAHLFQLHAKRGKADCAIAAMATVFQRDPAEVLIAAAKVSSTVWHEGLSAIEMSKVAKRLKVKVRWKHTFDPEEEIGVLVVGYHDKIGDHCVALFDGWIVDPEHNPVTLWRYDDFYKAHNAYGTTLLEVIE